MYSKLFLLLLSSLFLSNAYSQNTFQRGHYVNQNSDTIQCFIKNLDWRLEPQKILIKASESQNDSKVLLKNEIKSFEIYGEVKYVKAVVDVDRAPQNVNIDLLTEKRSPDFKKEEVLLKELYSGEYVLYVFNQNDFHFFYLKNKEGDIDVLVFKEYLVNDGLNIKKNNYYQQQLYNIFEKNGATYNNVKELSYEDSSLIKFFQKYDKSNKVKSEVPDKMTSNKSIRVNIKPGISIGDYVYEKNTKTNSLMDEPIDFGSKTNFRIGVELEIAFSFNHQKWRIYIEPSYRKYHSSVTSGKYTFDVNYQSLYFPIGGRYYSYINPKLSLYYNVGVVLDQPINSTFEHNIYDNPSEITSKLGYHLGVGFKYNDRWGSEFRYNYQGSLFRSHYNNIDKFKTFELNFIYSIF
ncbi:outer membrane beta-barrel protein [Flammeovirga pacifica]|uniref:Outer membrane protein beta-barrel domain-containing protein n=1 Tax=Flammeovirga pacifica TaxID=915059 RepID=A0A1S1Z2G2_FLAPC|nr:outer membrane beta-barrel protein [Flammeovirga pacifica]OHX67441.1 hypothetical protein NH26_14360 [Flammeovirga pacifica]